MASRPSILFLCTANSARSQMAEAYLKTQLATSIEVQSAGIHPRPIHPMAGRVMKELGISMTGQTSTGIDELGSGERFTCVIIVCSAAEQNCPKSFAPAGIRYLWPFDNPVQDQADQQVLLQRFRQVRDQIIERIDQWVEETIPEHWRSDARI